MYWCRCSIVFSHRLESISLEVEQLKVPPVVLNEKVKDDATYMDEDRVKIGRYATENSNIAALKRYKSEPEDLIKSTVDQFL